MSAALLPPNSTPLVRAIADAMVLGSGLPVAALRGFKTNSAPPATIRPWLIKEYGLTDIERYLPAEQVLPVGLAWSRLRGTAAALPAALAWLGVAAVMEEEQGRYWWQVQLAVSAVPGAALADIKALTAASLPARAELYRLHDAYDLRPLKADFCRFDGAMLDSDSGVWADGVKLSFSARHAAGVTTERPAVASTSMQSYRSVCRAAGAAWDRSAWDEVFPLVDAGSTLSRGFSRLVASYRAGRGAVSLSAITLQPPATRAASATASLAHHTTTQKTRYWRGAWRGKVRSPIFTKYQGA